MSINSAVELNKQYFNFMSMERMAIKNSMCFKKGERKGCFIYVLLSPGNAKTDGH